MSLSTHVLDATTGMPAAGLRVELHRAGTAAALDWALTDPDGRIPTLAVTEAGAYQLIFDTGGYYAGRGVATFYPVVTIVFEIIDPTAHHHVPLLLSPFAYSTYRGS